LPALLRLGWLARLFPGHAQPISDLGIAAGAALVARQIVGDGLGGLEIRERCREPPASQGPAAAQQMGIHPMIRHLERAAFPNGESPAGHEADGLIGLAGKHL